MPYLQYVAPAFPGFSVGQFSLCKLPLQKTYPCNCQSHPCHVCHPWFCYSPGQLFYHSVILLLVSTCLGIFHLDVIWLDGAVGYSVWLIAPLDQLMVLCQCLKSADPHAFCHSFPGCTDSQASGFVNFDYIIRVCSSYIIMPT